MTSHRFEGFTPINSGHLDGVKYNSFENKMTVRFQNGYVYDVHGFRPSDYKEFLDAPSQGQHYHAVIKQNFHVERVK